MKYLALALSLSLAACATEGNLQKTQIAQSDFGAKIAQNASTISAKTVIAANDLYTAASKSGVALVQAGIMNKATFKAADANAYAMLLKLRAGRVTFEQFKVALVLLGGK